MAADAFPEVGGLLSFPWLLAVPPIALVLVFLWTSRGHLRDTLTGKRQTRRDRVFPLLFIAYVLGFQLVFVRWDPIAKGSIYAPGPGIEVSRGGRIECFDISNPCSMSGPLYRIKVAPGQKFTVLTSIRNKGPFPITLLGPGHLPVDASTPRVDWFLAEIWSAPDADEGVFPDASQLQPFRPIAVWPGEQAPVVLVLEGGACADPGGVEDRGTELNFSISNFSVIYEFAFWHRESALFPQFEISVPVDRSCMAAVYSSALA